MRRKRFMKKRKGEVTKVAEEGKEGEGGGSLKKRR